MIAWMIARPWLLAGVLGAAAGAAGAWQVASWRADAAVAKADARRSQCEQARAEDARAAAAKTAELLARAQHAEADAARRLAAQKAAFDRRVQEVRRDIHRLSSGSDCLAPRLRLRLNAAIASGGELPESAGDAARAAPGPAADPGGEAATDADIAGWALDVARLYEDCRARIAAIGRWDEVTHGR